MYINLGEKLPSINLYEKTTENMKNIVDLISEKKAMIFGVPGAFVPGCSRIHLGGFIEKAEELKSMGYEEIICISVNDPFVLSAWGIAKGAEEKIRILADPTASFTKAIGMEFERPDLGGIRSRRYCIVTIDAVVKEKYVEEPNDEPSCLQPTSITNT